MAIKVLDKILASKIAAGEVIERPASVLKELMENSIDAGSSSISVYAAEGGKRLLRVVDNGEGISREDAPLAFLRHATSKISKEDDLEHILTMGFRGEALASIATIAKVQLRTRRPNDVSGTSVTIEGGGEPVISDDGCPEGTSIEVKDLFYNTPARLKFLRSSESEYGRLLEIFKTLALINPGTRFKLVHGSSRGIETPPGTLKERIADLFGNDISKELITVDTPFVKGYIGGHILSNSTNKSLHIYLNGRSIRDKGVNRAIIDGYGAIIDGGRYPFAVLDLIIPPEDVDVNIHPTKSEVRFKNPKFIYDAVKAAVKGALASRISSIEPKIAYSSGNVFRAEQRSIAGGPSFNGNFLKDRPQVFARAEETSLRLTEETPEIKSPEFLSLSTVGQLWGEFLVAESYNNSGEFYLIDQHGAAERIAFERLKAQLYGAESVDSQMLLIPERIETTPEERDEINGILGYLKKLGFDVVPFGPSNKTGGETFIIKSVPALISSRSCGSLIKDLAEEIASEGGSIRAEERIEAALMRIACHSVIRGPRALTKAEGDALLREMAKIDFAGHCPHGRPVVKKFMRSEIETMFKR